MGGSVLMPLAYIGPQMMLPFASVFAAAIGFILMFWKYVFRSIRRVFDAIFCRKQKIENAKTAMVDKSEAKGIKN